MDSTLPANLTAASLQTYRRVVLLSLCAMLLFATARFSGMGVVPSQNEIPVDFHAFYAASQMISEGNAADSYHFEAMSRAQAKLMNTEERSFLPWSYPPQFGLLVSPFSLLPVGAAYFLFIAATLIGYAYLIRALAGPLFPAVLLSIFPALLITISTGQNGFLSGALVALACLGLMQRKALAGLPLGLMVIKPHLVVGLGIYTLLTRRWRTAAVAFLTIAATSVAATLLLGANIWAAFFHGLHETRIFLAEGFYPLHRMISVYAALVSFGAPARLAGACQLGVALFSLAMILAAVRSGMKPPQQLGLAVIGSLLVSPYAYDYDLAILGVGLAILLPDLLRLAKRGEQIAIFGLSFFTSALGLANNTALEIRFGEDAASAPSPASIAGFSMLVLMTVIWRVLRRERSSVPAPAACEPEGAVSAASPSR